jgi:DUF1365 family protein
MRPEPRAGKPVAGCSVPTLCEGSVAHRRLTPRSHAFRHRVFFLRIPLSQLTAVGNRWLSRGGRNLMSLDPHDYGPRDGSDLAPWARARFAAAGVADDGGEIVLQTFPRVLGYVFNPITLWFAHDRAGALRAVLCEVSNTFGERHDYLVAHADGRAIAAGDRLRAQKALHVSPFCAVTGYYEFRFASRGNRCFTGIDYFAGHATPEATEGLADGFRSAPTIATSIGGRTMPLTEAAVLSAFIRYPLFTLGVMGRIHWHALRLWLKRVPWFPKPPPPASDTTYSLE